MTIEIDPIIQNEVISLSSTFPNRDVHIRSVSLFLSRLGFISDYHCKVSIYESDESGSPIGCPLGISIKEASDIIDSDFYNFIFDPIINVEGISRICIVFNQTLNNENNFIFWHFYESDKNDIISETSHNDNAYLYGYGNGYGNGYGYIYGYGESEGNIGGQDFFNVFCLDSCRRGYGLDGNYGFEYTGWIPRLGFKRIFKIYSEFNEVSYDIDSAYIKIPEGTNQEIVINDASDFYDGYRRYVDISGNRVTLRDVGKRVAFFNMLKKENGWFETNRNLPADVSDICFIKNDLVNSPYNLIGAAATADGIFITINSGSIWKQLEETNNLKFDFCSISPSDTLNKYIIVCAKSSEVSVIEMYVESETSYSYEIKNIVNVNKEIKCILFDNNIDSNKILLGTYTGIVTSSENDISSAFVFSELVPDLSSTVINSIKYYEGLLAICSENGLYTYDMDQELLEKVVFTDNKNINDFIIFKDRVYICLDSGILVSQATSSTLDPDLVFIGDDFSKNPYITGIKKDKVNYILKSLTPSLEDDILFVCSNSGIYSSSSGFDFNFIGENLYPDIICKKMYINPCNSNLLHALLNTVKKSIPFVTIIIDESGSMFRRENDEQDDQYSLAARIMEDIEDESPEARFQVVLFSTKESESDPQRNQLGIIKERKGAINLTGGFVKYSSTLYNMLKSSYPNLHYKTPLYETLFNVFRSIYNNGAGWEYSDIDKEYKFERSEDELFRNSDKIVILITDGNDTNSIKQISDINQNLSNRSVDIKNSSVKMYTIAYGEGSNLNVLNEISAYNSKILYARNGNDDDYNNIKSYIVQNEGRRTRTGNFRKNFTFKNSVFVKNININVNISDSTNTYFRYRVSKNKYDLGDFTRYTELENNGQNTIAINKICRYAEAEVLLISKDINDSPSINSIKIDYVEPSESTMLFDLDSSFSEDIHKMLFTVNGKIHDFDSNSVNILSQNNEEQKIEVNPIFTQSGSNKKSFFSSLKLDRKGHLKNRILEKMYTNNNIIYYASNGRWSAAQSVSVYSGSNILSKINYYEDANSGRIIFNVPRKTSENIKITVFNKDIIKLGLSILNTNEESIMSIQNIGYELMPTESTSSARESLPIFKSQLSEDSYGILNYRSEIPYNENNIIYGQDATITVSMIVKNQISNNKTITFGFGNIVKIDDSYIYLNHENTGIFSELQSTDDNNKNYFDISCNRAGVNFFDFKKSIDYVGLYEIKTFGEIRKGDIVTIKITDFNTTLSRNDEFGQISSSSSETNTVIESVGSISTNFVFKPQGESFKMIEPNVVLSSTKSADKIHISCPSTPSSDTFDIILSIIDDNGVISTNSSAEVLIRLYELDTRESATLSTASVSFAESDRGSKKVRVMLPAGYNKYIISATYMSSGDSNINAGSYSTYSGVIMKNNAKKILWGDLNAKSSLGTGRNEPGYVYSYAQNVSGIDFCAIADKSSLLTNELWELQKTISDNNNISGKFVTLHAAEWVPSGVDINVGRKVIVFGGDGSPSDINTINSRDLNSLISGIESYSPIFFTESPSYSNTNRYKFVNADFGKLSKINSALNIENAFEIYSEHGNSESFELTENRIINGATSIEKSYSNNAIKNGFKVAFVANSNSNTSFPGLYAGEIEMSGRGTMPSSNFDNNTCINNRGLTAVLADDFSRDGIFKAIKARNTYCTTGARTHIDFKLGQYIMGDEIEVRELRVGNSTTINVVPTLNITIKSTSSTATAYVIKVLVGDSLQENMEVFAIETFSGLQTKQVSIEDIIDGESKKIAYFLRVVQSDNHMAWTSPIYINYIAS